MSFLERLFGGRPDSAAFFNRGATKRTKGDLDGAIADFTKTIELQPDFMAAYVNRGIAKQAKRDLDGAIADFTKAIELKPDNVAAYVCRGSAKHVKGDLDGAVADHTKAIELKPEFAESYHVRGLAKQDKGDLEGAIEDYTKAIGTPKVQCPTCGTNYRLGDDATMVTSQDVTKSFQRGGATIIGRDGVIAGEAWSPVATQKQPALIGRKRNQSHLTGAQLLENVTDLLENVSRIRETIEKGGKAFWYCEKCRKNEHPHTFPSDF